MLPEWLSLLGLMALPLMGCSLVALAICFERIWHLISQGIAARRRLGALKESLRDYKHYPKAVRDEALTLLLQDVTDKSTRGISALRLVGALSPLLGLLGTVLGIITAFQQIARHDGPVSPALVADGLWEAMLTTAAGLAIAAPCLLCAWIFQSLGLRYSKRLEKELNWESLKLETAERQISEYLEAA